MKLRLCNIFLLCVFLPLLTACAGVSYLAQSANGHADLLAARESVDKLAVDPEQPEALRSQLKDAQAIRRFAVDELGLPDNKSYTSYVDVGRPYVTVAVFAAPEFSLFSKLWCFPVFGCVPYRAYFDLEDARKLRDELSAEGYDTHLAPVTAYSTLGWTSDPLLNTMFRDDPSHLPAVVFHELAHQQIYIANDSAFNEAFAVSVERMGVKKWFLSKGQDEDLRAYEADIARAADFRELLNGARVELAEIYASSATEAEKRVQKSAAFDRLRGSYKKLRDGKWRGYSGYDGWFAAPINNARIGAVAVYTDLVPDFVRLFLTCGGDFRRFYQVVESVSKISKAKRLAALQVATCS